MGSWFCAHSQKIRLVLPTPHNLVHPVTCNWLLNCTTRVLTSFIASRVRMSSSVKLFTNSLSPLTMQRPIFHLAEFAETVWRSGTALPNPPSWLQRVGPVKRKGGEGKESRDGGREERYPQFLNVAVPLVIMRYCLM